MMELHLNIRDRVFAGEIYPVGDEPSGKSISGFVSTSGVAIFFREIGSEHETAYLPGMENGQWNLIAGNGTLLNGKLTMKSTASFAVFECISK